MNINKLSLFTVAAFAGLSALPQVAVAQPEPPVVVTVDAEVPFAMVSYADLNLRSSAGLSTLNGRVRAAAQTLCHNADRPSVNSGSSRCRNGIVERSQAQIDSAIANFGSRDYAAASSATLTVR